MSGVRDFRNAHVYKILEISLRKKPSNKRQNPPKKQRKIQDLLRPSTVKDKRIAMNHSSRAILIIAADYISENSPILKSLTRAS
jgi:GTP:adenosylcobinamide-phosphate guanylyltransferase